VFNLTLWQKISKGVNTRRTPYYIIFWRTMLSWQYLHVSLKVYFWRIWILQRFHRPRCVI